MTAVVIHSSYIHMLPQEGTGKVSDTDKARAGDCHNGELNKQRHIREVYQGYDIRGIRV